MKEIKLLIDQGREYQLLWPQQKALSVIFSDPRIIKLSKLLQKSAAPIACVSFVVQYIYFGHEVLPRALAMSLLVLSIPYQSLIWLGYRAKQPLPLGLISWCAEIRNQMLDAGISVQPLSRKASYRDMAHLLNQAYSKLNKAFDLP
ncbi:MAG: terminus macrodomain insulation protein YfbV [Psychrobium sp.]